jgi:hypothetical protein
MIYPKLRRGVGNFFINGALQPTERNTSSYGPPIANNPGGLITFTSHSAGYRLVLGAKNAGAVENPPDPATITTAILYGRYDQG